ncbi:lipoyl domain-containing protein [Natronobeatus ordinarius]|uniref:lipoyl domain-containing protein n=1 Tax=Natronobeatus ordinarius TaxID=2963433 RepID=UPI0020CE6299|nr:lipoyl domain-containing protein [Natronobeatus ordinarius]
MSDVIEVDAATAWPEDAEDVDEGVIATWFAREGGTVEEGETICEIQVEKVSVDVPAPASGTLTEIVVGENEEFHRDDVLGRIEPD